MALRAIDVSDWGFFRFHGPDAASFLQGFVTADVRRLAAGACLPACVLTPKGLLVADFELYQESDQVLLAVTRPAAAEGFAAAFEKKLLLSSSELKRLQPQAWLVVGAGLERGLPWPRLAEPARLLLGVDPPEEAELLSADEFHEIRIASGFPWFGADMDGGTLPLEARQEAAISLDKGCYMGQETVSRLVHRGHVNRRLFGLKTEAAAAAPGTPVRKDGVELGRVTSAAGRRALAMLKVPEAAPGAVVEAGGLAEVIEFPSWAAAGRA